MALVLFWNCLLESVILVLSLSTDALAASLGYGAGGISVPRRSVLVISMVCSGMLAISMLAGRIICAIVPGQLTRWLCFALLLCLGIVRLLDNIFKAYIRRHNSLCLRWGGGEICAILTVYSNTDSADADRSKTLSTGEATTLALALSLDSLVVGLGAAATGVGVWLPSLLSVVFTGLAVAGGCALGRRLGKLLHIDLSWLSGVLLIILAIMRVN